MHPHAPDSSAANSDPQHAARQIPSAVLPGQGDTRVTDDPNRHNSEALSDDAVTLRIAPPRHVNPLGGPAHQWNVYYDAGQEAQDLAEHLAEVCAERGVHCVVSTIDDYDGPSELKFVQGVVLVFSTVPTTKHTKMPTFKKIEDHFRLERPVKAIQGYVKEPNLSHHVGLLQVIYTDHALDNTIAQGILNRACATHPYTPGTPFEGNLFEVLEPGKAELVKRKDEVATSNAGLWRKLRRWGIDNLEQAWAIRNGIDHEIHRLDNPEKKVLYRPLDDIKQNQLWLALHKPELRPPVDAEATPEENAKVAKLFVNNSARAIRDAVANLNMKFDWFRKPDEATRRGGTDMFADMYDVLRAVTGHS